MIYYLDSGLWKSGAMWGLKTVLRGKCRNLKKEKSKRNLKNSNGEVYNDSFL